VFALDFVLVQLPVCLISQQGREAGVTSVLVFPGPIFIQTIFDSLVSRLGNLRQERQGEARPVPRDDWRPSGAIAGVSQVTSLTRVKRSLEGPSPLTLRRSQDAATKATASFPCPSCRCARNRSKAHLVSATRSFTDQHRYSSVVKLSASECGNSVIRYCFPRQGLIWRTESFFVSRHLSKAPDAVLLTRYSNNSAQTAANALLGQDSRSSKMVDITASFHRQCVGFSHARCRRACCGLCN